MTALFKYLAYPSYPSNKDIKAVLEKKEKKLSFNEQLAKYGIWFLIGFSTVLGNVLSSSALRYVNYPTQILARSCKPIPVMIFSVFLAREKYPFYRYVVVGGICIGVSIFFIGQNALKGKTNSKGDESIWGYLLLLASLGMDGICNGLQQRLRTLDRPTEERFMFMVNITGLAFLSSYLLLNLDTEFYPPMEFLSKNSHAFYLVLGCSISMCLGTIFIFKTVAEFGTLVLSILTTTRKFFTLLFSVFWNGHQMSQTMWFGVYIVFGSLFYDVYRKYFNSLGELFTFIKKKLGSRYVKKAEPKKDR